MDEEHDGGGDDRPAFEQPQSWRKWEMSEAGKQAEDGDRGVEMSTPVLKPMADSRCAKSSLCGTTLGIGAVLARGADLGWQQNKGSPL